MCWISLLTCMANDKVEALVSLICISKLLKVLHTTFDFISDSHPKRYGRAAARASQVIVAHCLATL